MVGALGGGGLGRGFSDRKESTIEINAKEKVSGVFNKVKQASSGLGTSFLSLGRIVMGLVTGMLVLKTALGLAATFMVGMPTIQAGVRLRDYNRVLRRSILSLRMYGIESDQAERLLNNFTKSLDRATATSILSSSDAMGHLVAMGQDTAIMIGKLSQELAYLTDLDPGQVFNAFANAITRNDISQLEALFGSTDRFSEFVATLKQKDTRGIYNWAEAFRLLNDEIKDMSPENVDLLAERMGRLGTGARPLQETAAEISAGTIVTVLDSIFKRIGELGRQGRLLLIGGLLTERLTRNIADETADKLNRGLRRGIILAFGRGSFTNSIIQTVRQSTRLMTASRFGTGIAGGLATAFILDFGRTLERIVETPKVLFPMAAIGAMLGSFLGGRLGAGVIAGLLFFLVPGLQTTFKDISIRDSILVSVAAAGFLLGKRFIGGRGISGFFNGAFAALSAFQLGKYIAEIIEGDPDTKASWLGLGTILGSALIGAFVGGPIGALIGTQIGFAISEEIEKVFNDEDGSIIGGFQKGYDKLLDSIEGWLDGKTGQDEAIELNIPITAIPQATEIDEGLLAKLVGLDPERVEQTRRIADKAGTKIASALGTGFRASFPTVFEGSWAIDAVTNWASNTFASAKEYVNSEWNKLITFDWIDVGDWPGKISTWFTGVFGGAKESVTNAWNSLISLEWSRSIIDFAHTVGSWFVDVFQGAKEGVTNWWNWLITLPWVRDAVSFAHTVGGWFIDVFKSAKEGVTNWFNWLIDLPWVREVVNFAQSIINWIGEVVSSAWSGVREWWDWLINLPWVREVFDFAQDIIDWFGRVISNAKGGVKRAWDNLWSGLTRPNLPMPSFGDWGLLPSRQNGGIVPGRLGQPVPIMAHGGEFIGPRERFSEAPTQVVAPIYIGDEYIGTFVSDTVRRDGKYKGGVNAGNISAI